MIETHRLLTATWHADLSDAHPGEDYWLHACGQRYPFVPHDGASRAKARAEAPQLAAIPDDRMTHYTAEPVRLPSDTVVRVHIKHTLRTFLDHAGEHGIHHVAIHCPPVPIARTKSASEALLHRHHHKPIDYVTTAKSLVFHHADLINKDPQTTAIIQGYMNSNKQISGAFDKLAVCMKTLGPATENSGWAHLVPFKPNNGTPRYDGKTTYYFHQPVEDVITAAGPVMTMMMKATKNDPALEVHTSQETVHGQPVTVVHGKWTQATGTSVVVSDGDEVMKRLADLSLVAEGGDDWRASLANSKAVHGLTTAIAVVNADRKQLKITLKNSYIRYLGVYIRFFDAEGNAMSVPGWGPDDDSSIETIVAVLDAESGFDIQYDDLRFIGYIPPINNIFAIPITSDPGELEVKITFPEDAVSASIYGSGLGTGSDEWPRSPLFGGVLTGLINLGVPAFMLAGEVAAQSYKPLYDIIEKITGSKAFLSSVILGGVAFLGYEGGRGEAHKPVNWRALSSMGQLLFSQGATKALVWVEEQMAEEEAAEEIPFAGWIMVAIDIATGLAQMAETIVEVASSPWNIENKVATSITTQIALHPDPRHKAFPQGPEPSYTVKMIYKGQTRPTRLEKHELVVGFSQSVLDSAFENNTLGGQVKFEADFYLDEWLAGKATTGWMDNDASDVDNVTLYLVQYPVPLSDKSIYQQAALLTYQDNAYGWQQTKTPPKATIASRNTADTGNAISAWHGLSLSQRHATIGFAWKAAGMGITSCVSHQGGQLNAMMNVDIPGAPMGDAQFPSCGLEGPTQLIYDPYPPKFQMKDGQWVTKKVEHGDRKIELPVPDPADQDWGAYWVDPRKSGDSLEKDGGYHLRKFTLDPPTPFNLGSDLLSYGRFAYFPNSFVMHPSGHVIAVTSHDQINKLQIANLVPDGAQDDDVPVARTYAGQAQQKDRRGLLFFPVAVTASYDGTVFVLEDTKSSGGQEPEVVARIQAFDLYGNPVNRFFDTGGSPSPFLDLSDAADKTYLDLAAIGNLKMTYLYVLYYTGDGSAPSDYSMAIYQYGMKAPATNPLVSTPNIPADRLAVDMWHTVYTLNFNMVTDGQGHHAGPMNASTGPDGRTVPSLSEWIPPLPTPPSAK